MPQLTENQHLLLRKLVYNEVVKLEQLLKEAEHPMRHSQERLEQVRVLDDFLAAQRREYLRSRDRLFTFMIKEGSTPDYER